MAWLKKDSRLRGHPKLVACADALDLKPVYLEGHLDSFWLACLERYEDGDVSKISNTEIAILAEYNTKHADRFVQLLQKHRWLDDRLIHDWLDYVGDYLKRKYRKSPDKLAEIYRKHGRESELSKKDTSGTRTGHVPDTSGTTQEVDKDIEKETSPPLACACDGVQGEGKAKEPPPDDIPDSLIRIGEAVVSPMPVHQLRLLLLDGFPADWIEKALLKTGRNEDLKGKRAVDYARRILQDWKKTGGPPEDGKHPGGNGKSGGQNARGRTKPGKYADLDAVNFGN